MTDEPLNTATTSFKTEKPDPQVVRLGLGGVQACVPAHWTNEEIEAWANRELTPPDAKRTIPGARLHLRTQEECDACAPEEPDRTDWQERCACPDRKAYAHVVLLMQFN